MTKSWSNLRMLLIAAGFIGGAGLAHAATFAEIDVDQDGGLTPEEFSAAYPEATQDLWFAIDVNADDVVSEEEHQAAVENGLLPPAT